MDREQDVLADLFYETMEEHGICTHHPALLLRSREKEWYLPCRERYFMVILKMESQGGMSGSSVYQCRQPPLQLFLWNLEKRQDDGLWKHRILLL